MTNPHEEKARGRKASAIRDLLITAYEHSEGVSLPLSEIVAAMGPADRLLVALSAGQHAPSDETWALVVEMIQNHEAAQAKVRAA